jgi:hypothetical protein
MSFRRLGVLCAISIVIAASSALADDFSAPGSVKAPAHPAKGKNKVKPAAPVAGMEGVKFSDPSAPLVGGASSPKLAVPTDASGALSEPAGGPALDLKWHADNDHINNPYWQPWVPNGQGYNVQAGVKVGF